MFAIDVHCLAPIHLYWGPQDMTERDYNRERLHAFASQQVNAVSDLDFRTINEVRNLKCGLSKELDHEYGLCCFGMLRLRC